MSNESLPTQKIEENSHNEAVAFAESHKDFFEHYARGQVTIKPAPEGLDTFAFNLENNEIYLNSRFYKEIGLSDEKTTFATLNEIEHFLEKKAILSEDGGVEVFQDYVEKIKKSQAWGLMDNCVADIRENRAVTSKTNQGLRDIEEQMYRDDLFPTLDLSNEPMHTQLPQALLRESRVLDEMCTVSQEVRDKINHIRSITNKNGNKLIDVMTDPQTPMSIRLKLQEKFIWPAIEELLKKDIENDKKKKEERNKDQGEQEGEQSKKDDSDQGGKNKSKSNEKSSSKPQSGGKDVGDDKSSEMSPDQIFKEAYDRASKRVPNAVPIEGIEKALKEWQEKQGDNPLDNADKKYAENLGVKKEDLQKYRKIIEELNQIRNPETNETIVEELRGLVERIIARRLKPKQAPRYPVEEGEDLADPAQLVADAKAGNFEPKVWETQEIRQERGQRFGEIEITLICDRSSSMTDGDGSKLYEQRKAVVFLMEALKEFSLRADEEINNIDKPLEVKTEIRSFQSSSEDLTPIKKMSSDLSEKDRISVTAKISSAPGSTTDFVPLEKIRDSIDEETLRKIKDGELKKIIVVFTDGGSDDKVRVGRVLKELNSKGLEVICIAVTESGRPALTTYAPNAHLAEKAEDLPSILAEVLKDSLKNV